MAITFEPLPEWLQDELLFKVEEKLTHLRIPRSLDGFDYLALAIAQVAQNLFEPATSPKICIRRLQSCVEPAPQM